MSNEIQGNASKSFQHAGGFISKHTPIERGSVNGGSQYLFRFANGYGASLVNHTFSYGNELAVLKFDGPGNHDWDIDYSTPVTRDVLGHLDAAGIEAALDKIAALSASGELDAGSKELES